MKGLEPSTFGKRLRSDGENADSKGASRGNEGSEGSTDGPDSDRLRGIWAPEAGWCPLACFAAVDVAKEIKATTRALQAARERSSDQAKRELVVLRSAQTAHEERVQAFIRETEAELVAALREHGIEVNEKRNHYLNAARAPANRGPAL
jgi:hypothetical protein